MKWYDSILTKVKGIFNLGHDATESEIDAALDGVKSHAELKAQIKSELDAEHQKAVETALEPVKAELANANDTNADLQKQVDDLKKENAELKQQLQSANARITELEKEPAEQHTTGKTETEEGKNSKNLWDNNPVNKRARDMQARRIAN